MRKTFRTNSPNARDGSPAHNRFAHGNFKLPFVVFVIYCNQFRCASRPRFQVLEFKRRQWEIGCRSTSFGWRHDKLLNTSAFPNAVWRSRLFRSPNAFRNPKTATKINFPLKIQSSTPAAAVAPTATASGSVNLIMSDRLALFTVGCLVAMNAAVAVAPDKVINT